MRGYLRGTWGELSGCPNAFLQALAEVSGQHQRPRSGAVTPPPRWSGAVTPPPTVRGRHPSPAMVRGVTPPPPRSREAPSGCTDHAGGREADPQGRRGHSCSKTTGSAVSAQTPRFEDLHPRPRLIRGHWGRPVHSLRVGGAAGSGNPERAARRGGAGGASPVAPSRSPALSLLLCASILALCPEEGIIASIS